VGLFGPPDVEKLKAKGDVAGLIKALAYRKDGQVRRASAEALGRMCAARAVDALIAALRDQSWGVRTAAVTALRKIGDSRAVAPLIASLKDDTDHVRLAATTALGEIGDSRAVDPLIASLKDDSRHVRLAAATALGEIGSTRAVDALIYRLVDEIDWDVRTATAQALAKLQWQPGPNEAGAWYWAVRGQWDKCVEVGAPAVGPLIKALGETLARGAAEALQMLAGIPGQDSAGAAYWASLGDWGKCIETGMPAVYPLMVAHRLHKIDAPAVEVFLIALRHPTLDVRRAAATILLYLSKDPDGTLGGEAWKFIQGKEAEWRRSHVDEMVERSNDCGDSSHHDYGMGVV
jgi:hypothetical protein